MTALGAFVSGDVLTAADLNAIGTWTTYTPTLTNITVGNGNADFRYVQINKTVVLAGFFGFGSTSAITGTPSISLPVTAARNMTKNGVCRLVQFGVGAWNGVIEDGGTTAIVLVATGASGSYTRWFAVSSTVPFTWGNGSWFDFHITYEAA